MAKAPIKGHAAMKQHLANAKAAHAQTGKSLDALEQIMQQMAGAQQQQQQPAAPVSPGAGVSPLGGQAQ